MNLLEQAKAFAIGFISMLALGGGVLFALSLIWYGIPDELKAWAQLFMFTAFLFLLGASIQKLKGSPRPGY